MTIFIEHQKYTGRPDRPIPEQHTLFNVDGLSLAVDKDPQSSAYVLMAFDQRPEGSKAAGLYYGTKEACERVLRYIVARIGAGLSPHRVIDITALTDKIARQEQEAEEPEPQTEADIPF